MAGGRVDAAGVGAAGVGAAGCADVVVGVAAGREGELAATGDRDALDVTSVTLARDDRRGGVEEQAATAMTATAAASTASGLGRRTPQRRTRSYPGPAGRGGYADRAGTARSSSAGQRGAADDKEQALSGRGGGGFGGQQPNMQQLMKQAQKMQQQLEAAQAELAAAEVIGTAGGGLVTATVTGSGELIGLTIDPSAVDPEDVETLQDLVVAAVRDANRAAAELAAEKMGPVTGDGGLGGLGLPGF
jgi:DNA-binding YbaB/EbfC family protein